MSPVVRSAELTETKELSKTPIFMYICVCVLLWASFLFQDQKTQEACLNTTCFLQVETSKRKNIELSVNNLFFVNLFRIE